MMCLTCNTIAELAVGVLVPVLYLFTVESIVFLLFRLVREKFKIL